MIIGDKYRITGRIGSGGMGRVYVAEHTTLGRKVAVKILHHKYLGKRDLIKRFKTEALAASRMNHPNVVPVHDFGQDGSGQLFIVMDYVKGRSLETVLTREWPLGDARVLHVAIQILRALEEAHSHGILHRDLKPENILLEDRQDQVDQVHVLDFGLAKALDGQGMGGISKITAAGSTCGTPEYMSPEQAQGGDLDPRSDIYSLGVLMYRMVVGRPPFADPNPVSVAAKHVTDEVPVLHDLRPEVKVHPDVEKAIYRALSKRRDERYPDAQVMRDHLIEVLAKLRDASPLLDSLDSTKTGELNIEPLASPLDSSPEERSRNSRSGEAGQPAGANPSDAQPTMPNLPGAGDFPHVSAPWSGAEVPAPAGRRRRNPTAMAGAIALGLAVAAAVVFGLHSAGYLGGDGGPPPILDAVGPGVEVRPRGGLWMAAASPRQMMAGERLRSDGGRAALKFREGTAVELVRAEVEIVDAFKLELHSGAVRVHHPGGRAKPLEVRVSDARGTARLAEGRFRVGAVAPAGMSVANQDGQAEIDVPAGVVPVRSGTEVVYEAGKEPISRPIPADPRP